MAERISGKYIYKYVYLEHIRFTICILSQELHLRSDHRRIEGVRSLSQGRKKSQHECVFKVTVVDSGGLILPASPEKLLECPQKFSI